MKIQKVHIMGMIVAAITIIIDLIFLLHEKIFFFLLGIAVVVGSLPFLITFMLSIEKEKEKEEMFLEFSRNLVETVKSGTPISRSIINIKNKDFGSLTPHIGKLANQISLGIPVKNALQIFGRDVGSNTISRAITLISEAEQAGGEIESILESVAKSVGQSAKLRKERKAAVYNLVVQGYIIFFIFIIIMLVMEFKILPMTEGLTFSGEDISGAGGLGGFGGLGGGEKISSDEISRIFLSLLLVQGFFAGLTIGKLAEGSIKAGLKHSFILLALAFLVSTGVKAFLG